MRTAEEIMSLVLSVAHIDDRIRAVLLTGSRANPQIPKDLLQDFDIVFIVTEMDSFITDRQWIDVFGERRILQLPEEMAIGDKDPHAYHYLMLFKDHNRIDLTLYPQEKGETFVADTPATVLLDKDNLFGQLLLSNAIGYLVQRPDERLFSDCCNEFWWLSTYVAKGLWRNEITYAKEWMEGAVRNMFSKMIEWYIGTETAFSVSVGKGGRHQQQHLSPELFTIILATYPGSNIDDMWKALFLMAELFNELAAKVASRLHFHYNKEEAANVTEHLRWVHSLKVNPVE